MLSAWLVLLLGGLAVQGYMFVVPRPPPGSSTTTTSSSSGQSEKPDVYSLHITSHIQHRYAATVVSSRVANRANRSQEVFFSFVMPETAFISGFLMEIDSVVYKAHVSEKEEAKREYQAAVSHGVAAAHVAQSARDSNRFKVSVNIEPLKKVTFNLTYEELLKRRGSFYTHAINIDPGQIIHDLSVEVFINESRPIKSLQVPVLKESNEIDPEAYSHDDPHAVVEVSDHNTATVRWAPTEQQQRQLKAEGVKGQLAVRYDLDRAEHPEQILVNEGYFVHFFSPEELAPLPKHVVFVIDVSGSMYGRKIEQVKHAMLRILSDLTPADFFSFITFSTDVKVWDVEHPLAAMHQNVWGDVPDDTGVPVPNSAVVAATSDNINKSKEFTSRLESYSSTNIHGALMKGLQVAQLGKDITQGNAEPMVIFLTDGDPNVGESDPGRIVATVSDANSGRVAIFSLAFGEYADMEFLKKLSLRNSGFARKIYEASDASLQLQDFYRQISSPLLSNVTFGYTENQVEEESLSTTRFSTLFRGSELVVTGRVRSDNVTAVVRARGVNGTYTLDSSPVIWLGPVHQNSTPSSMERLWGYLTIQQLLEKETAGSGNSSAFRERALRLALRYSFVTPVTSLVVVKPNETSSADVEKGDTGGATDSWHPPAQPMPSPRGGAYPVAGSYYPVAGSYPILAGGGFPRAPMHRPGGAPHSHATSVSSTSIMGMPGQPGDLSVQEMSLPDHITVNRPPVQTMDSPQGHDDEDEPDPTSADLHVVPIDSISWINRTGNSYTITLQENPGSPPEILQLKTTNQTNEAFNACNSARGGPGHCRHLVYCALDVFQGSINSYFPFLCRIDNYAGVCCPDSLQPVAVQSRRHAPIWRS